MWEKIERKISKGLNNAWVLGEEGEPILENFASNFDERFADVQFNLKPILIALDSAVYEKIKLDQVIIMNALDFVFEPVGKVYFGIGKIDE